MTRATAPYGTWPSPVTPRLLAEQAVRLSDLSAAGDRLFWVEARPFEGGRQALVSWDGAGSPTDATPPEFSVRSLVHEYGGRCYAARAETVVFSNWSDQRMWVLDPREPRAVTPEPERPRALRYADPALTRDARWAICVRESHAEDGSVENDLVAVCLDPAPEPPPPRLMASGHDFYSSPRLSPDGSKLAWLTWDHPDMPFDATELWVAEVRPGMSLGEPVKVAGGSDESVAQPRWSPTGVLHYVSDRSGWWNLYDESGRALCPMHAEFAVPDWEFGNSNYSFAVDGRLVAAWSSPAGMCIGFIDDGAARETLLPYSSYSYIATGPTGVAAIAASPTEPPAVVMLDLDDPGHRVVRRSQEVTLDPEGVSFPEAVDFPTAGDEVAHALFYPPVSADYEGPLDERPPVVLRLHGGPTSAASPVLSLAVQFWTSRGFAVLDLDYRGSSGYGREYRRLLNGVWGKADVEDCAAVVSWLASSGRADGSRALIRGGSAGGFTTLAALAFTDTFAAGCNMYGVSDLERLAQDTHKFESRYLDRLIGPWPDEAETYRRRSPIHNVERIDSPLVIFQGSDDAVVPPSQSRTIYEALRDRGVPVAYTEFAGEQHGFRRADTIVAVAAAELAFYGVVLGFKPAPTGEDPRLDIANAERLAPRS